MIEAPCPPPCRASDPAAAQRAVASAAAQCLGGQAGPASTAALMILLAGLLAAAWPADAVLCAWTALLAADLAHAAQLLDRWLNTAIGGAAVLSQQQAESMGEALLDAPGAAPSLLAANSPSGRAVCLLARLQLARGDAAQTWELLSPCLQAACSAEPETVQQVVSRLFEERRFEQASWGGGWHLPLLTFAAGSVCHSATCCPCAAGAQGVRCAVRVGGGLPGRGERGPAGGGAEHGAHRGCGSGALHCSAAAAAAAAVGVLAPALNPALRCPSRCMAGHRAGIPSGRQRTGRRG